MPRLLIQRLQPDSVSQFRDAAELRHAEAQTLFMAGRNAAAIYLWGYAAEMTLKAAWFRLVGYPSRGRIDTKDLHQAVTVGNQHYGMTWKGPAHLHHVERWAELLIRHRAATVNTYADPAFPTALAYHAERIGRRWMVDLRYKRNRPYFHEVQAVAASATWLLEHADDL